MFQEKSFTITFCKPCKSVNFYFFFLYRKGPMALIKASYLAHKENNNVYNEREIQLQISSLKQMSFT